MATSSIDLGLRGLHHVEVIGSGGSAVVYKAVREVPGSLGAREVVAVKLLRSSWDHNARRRFEREQRVMGRLSDTSGFVPILETGETDDGSPYIVMPFYQGGSLQERVSRSGPIEWPRAVRLVEVVAGTLERAHELEVFHRDIKPANILLSESGRPHVADFGISLIADDPATRATSTAAFTPAYSPPESFIDGLMPVATTDIYGLAATLWATLSGHAPFKEPGEQPTPVTVFGRVAMHQVGDLRDSVPSPICRFIERAMAKIPLDRPATMGEFLAELQAAREDAYRGVEAERLVVKPLVDPGSTNLLDGFSTVNGEVDAGLSADVGEKPDGSAPPVSESSSESNAGHGPVGTDGHQTLSLGVLLRQAEYTASVDQADAAEQPDTQSADPGEPVDAVGPAVGEAVGEATSAVARSGGWLKTVAAVAASTVVLLFVGWWLLGPGAGTEADESSMVIVADGESAAEAVSSETGRSDDDAGGRSAANPTTSVVDGGAVGSGQATTFESAAPTASSGPISDSSPATPTASSVTTTTSSVTTTASSVTTAESTSSTLGSEAIRITSGPEVVSSGTTSVVFSYVTNDVCGAGSFEYTEVATGQSVGRWTGDRSCFGPLHFGDSRWPDITLVPGTTYLVTITVEGQPSDGVLLTGVGQATASLQVTTSG